MKRLLATALIGVAYAGCGGGSKSTGGCADPLMIDDMEDGDRFICASRGRTGGWYAITDATSTNISPSGEFTQSLIPGGRGASRSAAHMTGFGFTDWGAAMGFSLNGEGDAAQPYDASASGGVRFWMKSNMPIVVQFPIPETLSTGTAAACVDDGAKWNCDNHFQFRITAPPTDAWKEYDVPYAAAAQLYGIGPNGINRAGTASWDPARLVGVQFAVNPNETFDVWIDDVRFYSCAGDECLPTCADPGFPTACPATAATPASCRAAGAVCAQTITAFLPGVWGTGRDDVWAVGYGGTILHWNGTVWSSVPSGSTAFLSVPWGTAADDVWAVGSGGAILHWNGSAWSASDSGTTQLIYGVWGSAPDDVWAVGMNGTILRWDGSTWSPVPSGTSYPLLRVWGTGPNDVWAVGNESSAGVIVHWDGTAWSVIPGAPARAFNVSGSGPTDVWVVGAGAIVHWNGLEWTAVPTPTDQALQGVWANSPTDAWAVGFGGTIIHWNGSAWSPVASGTTIQLTAVWASGPNDAWVTGSAGTILHWDGTAWALVPLDVQ
jgi:hypothetical protein